MTSHDKNFSSNKEHDALYTTTAHNITKFTHYIIPLAHNIMHTNQYIIAYMPQIMDFKASIINSTTQRWRSIHITLKPRNGKLA